MSTILLPLEEPRTMLLPLKVRLLQLKELRWGLIPLKVMRTSRGVMRTVLKVKFEIYSILTTTPIQVMMITAKMERVKKTTTEMP
jgi:hypothetical protein